MCIGLMRSHDFPWNPKENFFLIVLCFDESQLLLRSTVDYWKFDNYLVLPTENRNQIINYSSVMFYIGFALPSLAIKMDACSWPFKSKLLLNIFLPGIYSGQCSELCVTKPWFYANFSSCKSIIFLIFLICQIISFKIPIISAFSIIFFFFFLLIIKNIIL